MMMFNPCRLFHARSVRSGVQSGLSLPEHVVEPLHSEFRMRFFRIVLAVANVTVEPFFFELLVHALFVPSS